MCQRLTARQESERGTCCFLLRFFFLSESPPQQFNPINMLYFPIFYSPRTFSEVSAPASEECCLETSALQGFLGTPDVCIPARWYPFLGGLIPAFWGLSPNHPGSILFTKFWVPLSRAPPPRVCILIIPPFDSFVKNNRYFLTLLHLEYGVYFLSFRFSSTCLKILFQLNMWTLLS